MLIISKVRCRLAKCPQVIFVFILIAQNLLIFSGHYFGNVGFPWDFVKTYYAIPAFWTTALKEGVFPQWIPFQSFGYPLALNAQSGLYYPFFWLFAIPGIQLSLDTAVSLQAVHVLIGAIGMFIFLNYFLRKPQYALLGAIAFQFFGGFYSNAEHQDIVRAFAFAPWIFFVFTLNFENFSLPRRSLFIPVAVYVLATGGYPGNFISTLFVMFVYVCLQLLNLATKGKKSNYVLILTASKVFGLAGLGIALSLIFLGPIYQEMDQLTRFSNDNIRYAGLWLQQLPSLIMPNQFVPGEISMTSVFIGLPVLVFASYVPLSILKKYWILLVVLGLAVIMAGGDTSPGWEAITSTFPFLKLSRFPSSDYRVFIAIPIILLGMIGLKAMRECEFRWKWFAAKSAFVVSWFVLILMMLKSDEVTFQVTASIGILCATIIVCVYHFRSKTPVKEKETGMAHLSKLSITIFILALILISADGFRVISAMQTWRITPYDDYYKRFNLPLQDNSRDLSSQNIFENLPERRQSREIIYHKNDPTFKGYLTGNYMTSDYGNTILNARHTIESNYNYRQYMLMEWTPILLDSRQVDQGSRRLHVEDHIFSDFKSLIPNSDFERGELGWKLESGRINHNNTISDNSDLVVFGQGRVYSLPIPIKPLTAYNIQADAMTINGNARIAVAFYDDSMKLITLEKLPLSGAANIPPNVGIQHLSASWYSSVNSAYIELYLINDVKGASTFWDNIALYQSVQSDEVTQKDYGINDITYVISLNQSRVMVENEIFFPGWRARLISSDGEFIIDPIVVNDVFRGWMLPPGNYTMVAFFDFPNLRLYSAISIISFIIWLFLVFRLVIVKARINKRFV